MVGERITSDPGSKKPFFNKRASPQKEQASETPACFQGSENPGGATPDSRPEPEIWVL